MQSRGGFREAMKDALRNTFLWRNLLAVAGIASMMLPWVYLDGSDSSLSGSELIAYTFVTGDERWDMLKESVLGAFALFLVPLAVAVLAVMVFVRTIREQHSIRLNAAAGLLPALIVVLSGSITSSDHLLAGRLVFPESGIIVMFLCQATLAAHSIWK